MTDKTQEQIDLEAALDAFIQQQGGANQTDLLAQLLAIAEQANKERHLELN